MSELPDRPGDVVPLPVPVNDFGDVQSVRSSPAAPSGDLNLRRLLALLKYGAAFTTVCVITGIVTIWVKFEALDSVGTYAVTAVQPSEWFATGLTALAQTSLMTFGSAVFLVAIAAIWHWLARYSRVRAARIRPLHRAIRYARAATARVAEQVAAHPFLAYVVLPAALLSLTRPGPFGSAVPHALRILAAALAIGLIMAAFWRLLQLVVLWIGVRLQKRLRPAGWAVASAAALIAVALVSTTWQFLSLLALIAAGLIWAAHHSPAILITPRCAFGISSSRFGGHCWWIRGLPAGERGGERGGQAERSRAREGHARVGQTVRRGHDRSEEWAGGVPSAHAPTATARCTARRSRVPAGRPHEGRVKGPIDGPADWRPFWRRLIDWASTRCR